MDYRVNEGHILSLTRVSASDDELVGTRHDIEILDYLAKPERWREDNLGYKVAVDYPGIRWTRILIPWDWRRDTLRCAQQAHRLISKHS